ncbi:hypothetical protein ACQKND_16150 [Viridibacillus arvi]|uniref:hypothetical protein n=1 Tax=Viridibacillus arvi TaxID=263475 RepID=UPI003D063DE4
MDQKVDFMTTLLIFAVCVIPLSFNLFVGQVKSNEVMNTSTELRQLIATEGGVTTRVESTVNKLKAKGFEVEFETEDGSSANGILPVGTVVKVLIGLDEFETSDVVIVNRRS